MTASVVIDGKTVVFCHGCEKPSVCTQQDSLPDNGWVLPFDTFGYYGGFDDNIDVLLTDVPSRQWVLCHDCVVKFLAIFPRLRDSFSKGLHLCESETPCCEWAWRGTSLFGQYDKDIDGNIVSVSGSHYQVVKNGNWIDRGEI